MNIGCTHLTVLLQKMAIELDNLRKSFVDEVNKLKGHVTLDINLERGRSVEAVSILIVCFLCLKCVIQCLIIIYACMYSLTMSIVNCTVLGIWLKDLGQLLTTNHAWSVCSYCVALYLTVFLKPACPKEKIQCLNYCVFAVQFYFMYLLSLIWVMLLFLQHATNAGKLLQLNSKMDTDIANLKTTFEQYRNDVLKFAGGKFFTEHNAVTLLTKELCADYPCKV